MAKKKTIFEQKQQWLKKVMSSDASYGAKVFAFCVFKRAYGDKVECWPHGSVIMRDGGFPNENQFKNYREYWVNAGALRADKGYHTPRQTFANFKYQIELDWSADYEDFDPTKEDAWL